VAEADETNNVNGPLKVKVTGPPPPKGPDLVIQSINTQIYGTLSMTVRYQMQICNVGSDPAGATQVHVYYDLTAPPSQGTAGDKSTYVPGLAPGACTTRNIYRYNTPSGSYNSYAQVDPNNVEGEKKLLPKDALLSLSALFDRLREKGLPNGLYLLYYKEPGFPRRLVIEFYKWGDTFGLPVRATLPHRLHLPRLSSECSRQPEAPGR